jgi:hypothetical protein
MQIAPNFVQTARACVELARAKGVDISDTGLTP